MAQSVAHYKTRIVHSTPEGGRASAFLAFHWRPEDYDETDSYLLGGNPPRWQARHIHFGTWDWDASPRWQDGHSIASYRAAEGITRPIGPCRLKAHFDTGYVAPMPFTVDVDCTRVDGTTETVRFTVPAGARGPSEENPTGDILPLVQADPLVAECKTSPYAGAGLFVDVTDVRLVEPQQAPGCRFSIWNDNPSLHSEALNVEQNKFAIFAANLGGVWGHPHVFDDGAGQVFLSYVDDGVICFRRRAQALGSWSEPLQAAGDGSAEFPSGGKNAAGVLWLVYQEGQQTLLRLSKTDGQTWGDDVALATDLTFPFAFEYNGILYIIGYRDGAQWIRRTADFGQSFLPYPDGSIEQKIAESDAQRVGFVKMESQGALLVAGVPREPEILTYVSKDDGWTWSLR